VLAGFHFAPLAEAAFARPRWLRNWFHLFSIARSRKRCRKWRN
jgi:hypothetical protein